MPHPPSPCAAPADAANDRASVAGDAPAGWAAAVARLAFGGGRRLAQLVPARLLQRAEDRLFYSIFHVTRVTNDAYGWRPPGRTDDDAAATPVSAPAPTAQGD